jgi:mevalonate kinase
MNKGTADKEVVAKRYYSNGKLLITGEYVVLDGAKAFALPTKFGQEMTVTSLPNSTHIEWISYDYNESIWFEDCISFDIIKTNTRAESNSVIKNTLIGILHEAYKLSSDFLNVSNGFRIITRLTFPKAWGLGTSSTLVNNIAQWLEIDAYMLLQRSFGGSGYDIACAQHNSGIVYQLVDQKPFVKPIVFNPNFKDKLYFVYLNKKQNSRDAILSYYSNQNNVERAIPIINSLTEQILASQEISSFAKALVQHEIEMSNVLELSTVQETLFEDFEGVVKSLGAWGGDFILCIASHDPKVYFKERGYEVVIPYDEMIL